MQRTFEYGSIQNITRNFTSDKELIRHLVPSHIFVITLYEFIIIYSGDKIQLYLVVSKTEFLATVSPDYGRAPLVAGDLFFTQFPVYNSEC